MGQPLVIAFLPVATSAEDLEVPVPVLLVVETHASGGIHAVMHVAKGNDAVERQVIA